MANWIRIASVAECPVGSGSEFIAGDRIVAIFNVDGEFFALDGICPHQGGPLGKGTLQGCIVTCPWHGWQFDVCSGQHQTSDSLRHATLPVRIDGESIFVDVDS